MHEPEKIELTDRLTIQYEPMPEELAMFSQIMANTSIRTCDEATVDDYIKKLAEMTPIASGKSREPVVFMLDSLSALEDMKHASK